MVVIYAEKSSLAKEIAHALGAGQRISLKSEPTVGYYEFSFNGEPAVLCHGVGHLAQLVPASLYDKKYEKWELSVFPCIPDTFRAAPKAATLNCLKLVKSFFDKADWLINATDPDREGELIFTYVCDVCKCDKPYKRVWIEDLTEKKIRAAFANLKSPTEKLADTVEGNAKDLKLAARARDITDWLVGINLTVAATKKYGNSDVRNKLLTVGRVQTATINMVVEREKAILSFTKTPFWKLTAVFSSQNGKFEAAYEQGNFTEEAAAQAALSECNGKNGVVTSVEVKHKTEAAPLLYNTTQLQIVTSKKFGWSADKTSAVMQKLYEAKLITYPRTSSEHLTEAMIPQVRHTLEKLLKMPEYAHYIVPEWAEFSKRHFDDSKVGSHTAVIATEDVPKDLKGLSEDEIKLYDLVARSVIKIIYPKVEYDDTTVKIAVDKHIFKATGKRITNDGWYVVDGKAEATELPQLSKGQELQGEYKVTEGETEPPKRYTEAELLAAMELAGQKLEDEEARTLMKLQKKGLGTDATRGPILKSLFDKEYFAKKGKSIYPTELGMYLIDKLPIKELKSAAYTGEIEKQLNNIALGKSSYDKFISYIKKMTAEWFKVIAESEDSKFTSSTEQQLICPFCGKPLIKLDWGYSCTGYKNRCKFHVNKKIAGKSITENQVIMLCKSGRTAIIKGFKAKSGSTFDAYLTVDKEKQEVSFQFPERRKK
ncbi:type IA DNA topoisomerase [Ruminococcus sp.]|uniref:type IA DNA topoisomerase n=1 Tax=Ruminococcus sp. TaxID=41978 RepID=UPI0025EBC138|nr:type IA DNA topoisomerase [Ruminococcus sp.]